jgi:transposase
VPTDISDGVHHQVADTIIVPLLGSYLQYRGQCQAAAGVGILLKTFGRVLPKGLRSQFPTRVRAAIDGHPVLGAITEPTLQVLEATRAHLVYDKAVIQRARSDDMARQLMSAPGVGTVVALAYMTGVEDPARFKRSSSVAAYFGMTPRRYQSVEVDHAGESPSAETAWCAPFCSRQPKCC